MSLVDSLEALVAEHDRIGSPIREELVPGVQVDRVEAIARGLGLTPPPELVELFAWHDLQERPGSPGRVDWFWPAGGFRLDEAVDIYRSSIEIGAVTFAEIGDELGPDQPPTATFTGFWRTDWFPVLGGSPETYAIECLHGGTTPGAIWRVVWHPVADFQTIRVAPNLETFIDAAVDLFRAGAYRWDSTHKAVVPIEEVFETLGLGVHMRPIAWPGRQA